ncbi:hypothetical protein [Streptomyces rubiginosohelvolus]|uniref:hypothetical protein n=1 Tax=Streptomyces rubiginosohelvolus TaxID=67362 RepID=UPI0036A3CDA3
MVAIGVFPFKGQTCGIGQEVDLIVAADLADRDLGVEERVARVAAGEPLALPHVGGGTVGQPGDPKGTAWGTQGTSSGPASHGSIRAHCGRMLK